MARIRTIKPEFWVSDQVVECSKNARLLFVGLWNFADDAGRHAASTKRLKGEVFPCDDLTVAEVGKWVGELLRVGLIELRETPQGVKYWQVTGWHHQRIDKPQPPKFDEGPTIENSEFPERSGNGLGTLPPDRKGKDRIGKDRIGDSSVVECSTTEPVVLVYPVVGDKENPNWCLTQAQVDQWIELYPGIDVLAECRKALAYVKANRRKTAGGMPRYLVGWLNRETNNGRRGSTSTGRQRRTAAQLHADSEAKRKAMEAGS